MEKKNSIILILVIIILILSSTLIYFYINKEKQKICGNNEQINVKQKVDENKELVYDANYSYFKPYNPHEPNFSYNDKSYPVYYKSDYNHKPNHNYSFKDINVPYININSNDANKANMKILQLFDYYAERFINEYEKFHSGNSIISYVIDYTLVSYKSSNINNNLSVLITSEAHGTDLPVYNYYSYNFDLNTLKLLSYEEVYKKLGFTDNNINDKVKEAIRNHESFKEYSDNYTGWNRCGFLGIKRENCSKEDWINKSIDNYTKSVKDKTITYYIDNNNDLNIIVYTYIPAGRVIYPRLIKINK